ncbi:zona pellucida protein AX 1 [Brachyhypopomus gauderio]|uniref:zona pellucida protein AX 1 n=1 Tax=Brachyhypopomus gauderio TaxID=698409 RepID=UPI0040430055
MKMLSLHWLYGFCVSWLSVTAVLAQTPFNQNSGLNMECVGNVMRLTLDKSLTIGSELQVDAINGSRAVHLTPELAAKCGYSMQSDHWGNTRIYTSLLSCFAQNQNDCVFNIGLRLRMYGNQNSDVREVSQTCEYNEWASREILCERNFMEVSVYRLPPDIEPPKHEFKGNYLANPKVSTSLNNVWRMVFYTPREKPMMLSEVQNAGYWISSTPSRLVLRSPYNMPETYSQNVNGVQMEVFRVTTYFRKEWAVTTIDTAAACPTGGLHFTDEQIIWYMPRYITPLLSEPYEILELFMGINGKRLDKAQMNAMGCTLSVTDSQIILTLPVGGPSGYYKSHALDYKYYTTYNIEPMLELLWKEGRSITKYKVQYPITTPVQPRPPQVIDNTDSSTGVFDVSLGSFLHDVELVNITFSTGVMTVAEANARGFTVQQHRLPNGSKTYSMRVPFSDAVVLKAHTKPEMTTYTLPFIYGLIILPEHTPFPQPALVEANLKDITLPTILGTCDEENFYIMVTYGNQGKNFRAVVGIREISTEVFKEYRGKENATHMSMAVPFLAHDVVFELTHHSSLRGRLDVQLLDAVNSWHVKNFSLACSFPLTMTECFSNGSMTALAVKVESAAQMVPSQLTLKDPSCKPTFSNDRFAYFSFYASSCGTTRMFTDGFMVYENEISVGGKGGAHQEVVKKGHTASHDTTEYRVTVSCYFMLNDTQTVSFLTKRRENEPFAETGVGELQVKMRLAKDDSYTAFYVEEDFPVEQYLRKPLYFEAVLQSTDPRLELVLENCWATVNDGVSTLRWDLIVNGCENLHDHYETIFHDVLDDRVQYPTHLKRFEVKMFAFVKNNVVLRDQVYVRCEAVICDVNQTDGICKKQCPFPLTSDTKRVRRGMMGPLLRRQVSSGKILLSSFIHF